MTKRGFFFEQFRNSLQTRQAVEKALPAKGFGGKDSWKGNRQGSNAIKLRALSLRASPQTGAAIRFL